MPGATEADGENLFGRFCLHVLSSAVPSMPSIHRFRLFLDSLQSFHSAESFGRSAPLYISLPPPPVTWFLLQPAFLNNFLCFALFRIK